MIINIIIIIGTMKVNGPNVVVAPFCFLLVKHEKKKKWRKRKGEKERVNEKKTHHTWALSTCLLGCCYSCPWTCQCVKFVFFCIVLYSFVIKIERIPFSKFGLFWKVLNSCFFLLNDDNTNREEELKLKELCILKLTKKKQKFGHFFVPANYPHFPS